MIREKQHRIGTLGGGGERRNLFLGRVCGPDFRSVGACELIIASERGFANLNFQN